jgi:leucyl-tRNA synthetase
MKGDNVLRVMGFDSFGLPAEQFAIQTGQHPEKTTKQNIDNMREQFQAFSFVYDWSREVSTTDPKYYQWTQWIFLQMYNSFFDPTEEWDDGFGNKIIGKAKPIEVLRQYLEEGQWHLEDLGYAIKAVPGPTDMEYDDLVIEEAIENARLVYLSDEVVNWCPALGTVLANEEVTPDGKSERGNHPVETRTMPQWMMRITDYAERLDHFEGLDWPESTIQMQHNWIGKSNGVEFGFQIEGQELYIDLFTTRPDTIFGVTFVAIAEDHELSVPLEGATGRPTGYNAIHVLTGKLVPIWTADYVLGDYGTGAVMGVPAHDERDFRFAVEHGLPIRPGLYPDEEWLGDAGFHGWATTLDRPYTGLGPVLVPAKEQPEDPESGELVIPTDPETFLRETCTGAFDEIRQATQYKLDDWIFSRQRYWGEPIPMVYDEDGQVYPLDESELPLELPRNVDFTPSNSEEPVAPLSKCREWIEIKGQIRNGKVITRNLTGKTQKFFREANTMPNWAGSCWYYLRYMDPHNDKELLGKEAKYWCNNKYATVDLYVGGSEHAVLHLLYARFWHMFLFDLGLVPNPEPFKRLIHQGMVTADAFINKENQYVDAKTVEVKYENNQKIAVDKKTGEELTIVYGKMGKSYKNGVVPQEIVEEFGIDVFRMYLMYMGPITQSREWNLDGIVGMERFYRKVQKLPEKISDKTPEDTFIMLQSTIKILTEQYENLHFNTGIASLIKFVNQVTQISIEDLKTFLILLAPIAPHLAEYLHNQLGFTSSILDSDWPKWNQKLLDLQLVKVPVTHNGKLRTVLEVKNDIDDDELKSLVLEIVPQITTMQIIRKDGKLVTIAG